MSSTFDLSNGAHDSPELNWFNILPPNYWRFSEKLKEYSYWPKSLDWSDKKTKRLWAPESGNIRAALQEKYFKNNYIAHWQRSGTDHFDILLLSGPKTINTKLCSSIQIRICNTVYNKGRIKFTKQKNRFFMSLKTGPPPHLHKPNMSNAPQQLKLTAWRHALHQQPQAQPKQIIIKEILYSVQLGYRYPLF
jgi:hypothetical protein